MKATEAKLLDFLKKSPQFVIPIYQRTYSWTEKECRQLWDDIVRTGSNDAVSAHFVGSIVYIEKGLSQVTVQSPHLVIDGQQRLTTVTLLLAALAKALGETEPVDGFSPRKLRNYYLLNPEETGERHYKLLLSQTDKASLTAIAASTEQPKEPSLRVTENFQLFEELIASCKGHFVADEAFRKEVLSLDACVTEEFLKLYVAYKAETNFVDVVPQVKRLRLALNLTFAEINDPKGLCEDVTGRGRWGNGDVQLGLASLDELPHVMSLVRQSFERQMGNGGEV